MKMEEKKKKQEKEKERLPRKAVQRDWDSALHCLQPSKPYDIAKGKADSTSEWKLQVAE